MSSDRLDERAHKRLDSALAVGHPEDEVACARVAKELLHAFYGADGLAQAAATLDEWFEWEDGIEVPELRRLARTLPGWRSEILLPHRPPVEWSTEL